MRIAALLIIALLCGCMGQNEAPMPAPDEVDPLPPSFATEITMHDCYEQGGSVAVPAGDYEDQLPEGFALSPYTGFGTAPRIDAGYAELFVIASECADDDGTPYRRAFAAVFVDPPSIYVNPGAGFGHLLLLSYWSDSAAHHQTLAAWGLQAVPGEVGLDLDETPLHREGRAQADDGALVIETTVAGPTAAMEASTARFFAGGDVLGMADAEFGAIEVMLGAATVRGAVIADGPLDGVALHGWGHDNLWRNAQVS